MAEPVEVSTQEDTDFTLYPQGDGRYGTKDGQIGVAMLIPPVEDEVNKIRSFTFKATYFSDEIRVEWDIDTMAIVIDAITANIMVDRGYARYLTEDEAKAYNAKEEIEVTPAPVIDPKPAPLVPIPAVMEPKPVSKKKA